MTDVLSQPNLYGFSPLARQFSDFMTRMNGKDNPDLRLAALFICEAISRGHICLEIDDLSGVINPTTPAPFPLAYDSAISETALRNASSVVGRPGDFKPLILDDNGRLYTYRYWQYEQNVAERLLAMADKVALPPASIAGSYFRNLIRQLFPDYRDDQPDSSYPAIAAFIALTRHFCLISGSPGTGKTTAVARILAFLLILSEKQELRIGLSAPTAKAAVRLQEAVTKSKQSLSCPDPVKQAIPDHAMTLHRLLGGKADGVSFAFDKYKPLPLDILVVDEASMIDLPLMSRLLDAVSKETKLILLGDPGQLSSVNAGALLGDICRSSIGNRFSKTFAVALQQFSGLVPPSVDPLNPGGIQDCMVALTRNYRFPEESPLGHFKEAVMDGNSSEAITLLSSGTENLKWMENSDGDPLAYLLKNALGNALNSYLKLIIQYGNQDKYDVMPFPLDGFRILCAFRSGPYGTVHLNQRIDKYLREALSVTSENTYYTGKAVMVTQNDYSLQLFNGDIGVFMSDTTTCDRFSVCFWDAERGVRKFSPYSLPPHETAFATTVHKSQGSEYDRVFLFLPELDSRLLCRELIYTGITRARQHLTVVGKDHILAAAISRKVARHSGLTEKLCRKYREGS